MASKKKIIVVTFDVDKHEYKLGDKVLISVTQLLKKHGLTKSYDNVDADVLKAKAERGTLVHKALEQYVKTGEKPLFEMWEVDEFEKYVQAQSIHLGSLKSECILHNDIVAGTCDLIITGTDNGIVDFKTSLSLDYTACKWQLSIYNYLNGNCFNNLRVFHFLDDKMKQVKFEPIDKKEIEQLLECERKGELYEQKGLAISEQLLYDVSQIEQALVQAEQHRKDVEQQAKEYRQQLMEAMIKQNIKSWETLDKAMLITIIEPTTRTSIDSVALKKDLPDIASKYEKVSNVKGSIKITLRS